MRLSDRAPQKVTKTVHISMLNGGMVTYGIVTCGIVSCGVVTCGMVSCGIETCDIMICQIYSYSITISNFGGGQKLHIFYYLVYLLSK